jgi:hypothetical protein
VCRVPVSLFGGTKPAQTVTTGGQSADLSDMTTPTVAPAHVTVFAAARSRAHSPTAALWHAVEVHRPTAEVDGACELTLCGSLARITPDVSWPTAARDVCPACVALTR